MTLRTAPKTILATLLVVLTLVIFFTVGTVASAFLIKEKDIEDPPGWVFSFEMNTLVRDNMNRTGYRDSTVHTNSSQQGRK
jgi:hypothetical protein